MSSYDTTPSHDPAAARDQQVPAASNGADFQGQSVRPATAAVSTPINDEIPTERGNSPTGLPPAFSQPSTAKAGTVNDKPDLKLIEAAASDDPFDLSRLRINPEMLETTAVKKLLTTVPVRKPLAQDFVRVRPELAVSGNAGIHRIERRSRNLHRRPWRGARAAGRVLLCHPVHRDQPDRRAVYVAGQGAGGRRQDQRMAHVGRHGCPVRDEKLGARKIQHGVSALTRSSKPQAAFRTRPGPTFRSMRSTALPSRTG